MLSLIFSKKVTVDKYRNDLIINIRVYSAVNKVRIPVEVWSTLRSNTSVIYGEDLEGPISSYSQGHPQQNECKFSAKYACTFFAPALFIRLLFQTKYMASNGKMADYRGCVLGTVHYPGGTVDQFLTHKICQPPLFKPV